MAAALPKIRMPSTTTTAGGQLRADAELVAEEDDQRGDEHVGDERHDEDLRVEDAVQARPHPAEDRVERGDDGDREVRLQPGRHGRAQHQPDDDADDQREGRDHFVAPGDGTAREPWRVGTACGQRQSWCAP